MRNWCPIGEKVNNGGEGVLRNNGKNFPMVSESQTIEN